MGNRDNKNQTIPPLSQNYTYSYEVLTLLTSERREQIEQNIQGFWTNLMIDGGQLNQTGKNHLQIQYEESQRDIILLEITAHWANTCKYQLINMGTLN